MHTVSIRCYEWITTILVFAETRLLLNNNNYKIYMHIFPNEKTYIGITGLSLDDRWKNNGSGYKGQPLVYRAINKYGWDNIKHIVLEDGLSQDEARMLERCYIYMYESNDRKCGYNIARGGDGCGMHSSESKELMSLQRKGKKKSDKARENMSAAFLGRVLPDDFREHLSKSRKGKPAIIDMTEYKIPVAQIDLTTRAVINTFESICDAGLSTGVKAGHICECCKFKRRQAGGYKWVYKSFIDNGGDPFEIKIDYSVHKTLRSVCALTLNTKEIAMVFRSIRDAARQIGVSDSAISRSVHSNKATAKGYKWCFEDELTYKEGANEHFKQ